MEEMFLMLAAWIVPGEVTVKARVFTEMIRNVITSVVVAGVFEVDDADEFRVEGVGRSD